MAAIEMLFLNYEIPFGETSGTLMRLRRSHSERSYIVKKHFISIDEKALA